MIFGRISPRQEYGDKRLFSLWDGAIVIGALEMQEYLEGAESPSGSKRHLACDVYALSACKFRTELIGGCLAQRKQYLGKYWYLCRGFSGRDASEEAFDKYRSA